MSHVSSLGSCLSDTKTHGGATIMTFQIYIAVHLTLIWAYKWLRRKRVFCKTKFYNSVRNNFWQIQDIIWTIALQYLLCCKEVFDNCKSMIHNCNTIFDKYKTMLDNCKTYVNLWTKALKFLLCCKKICRCR